MTSRTGRRVFAPYRARVAVIAARVLGAASRRMGRGGGTALPGLVAERVEPRIVARLARTLGNGRVVVTGTNGKTTTARMVANILRAAGRDPVHNRGGSNLMRGLAATLTASARFDGHIANAGTRAGVFEVDEATIPAAVTAIRPDVLLITNLFRDQLDRYGEVDSIAALWREAVAALSVSATLILNADDPTVAGVARVARCHVRTFGVQDTQQAVAAEHAADSRWCGLCGAEYRYDATFFWHIGHWRCPGCGDQRPAPDVRADTVTACDDGLHIVGTSGSPFALRVPLHGLYNAYNALAATAAVSALGIPNQQIATGLGDFRAAFGRQERLRVREREVEILLCKNPAGVNQVLHTLAREPRPLNLLLALNDDIADGTDVSWIWDVDFESLRGRVATLTATGSRAAEIALRLHYAQLGVSPTVERDHQRALRGALAAIARGDRLSVLPTYTAMLAIRADAARLAGRAQFWGQ